MRAALLLLALTGCEWALGLEEVREAPCATAEPVDFALRDVPSSSDGSIEGVTSADLDGDGVLDLVLHRVLDDRSATTSVIFAHGGLAETPATMRRSRVADINGDGLPDLVAACPSGACFSVFLNATRPGAAAITLTLPIDTALDPPTVSLAVAEVTGDGRPDVIVWRSTVGSAATLWTNTTPAGATTASFTASAIRLTDDDHAILRIGTFAADAGGTDLLVTATDATNNPSLWRVRGDASGIAAPAEIPVPVRERMVIDDVNRDGTPDLVVGDRGASAEIWLGGATDYRRVSLIDSCVGQPMYAFDAGGARDVVVVEPHGAVCVLAPAGDSFAPTIILGVAPGDALFATPDLTGDGVADLLATAMDAPLQLLASGSHCEP